jgi:hypothetical protein
MQQVLCEEDFREKDVDCGWVAGFGLEFCTCAEDNRGRRDLPISDLFQVVQRV